MCGRECVCGRQDVCVGVCESEKGYVRVGVSECVRRRREEAEDFPRGRRRRRKVEPGRAVTCSGREHQGGGPSLGKAVIGKDVCIYHVLVAGCCWLLLAAVGCRLLAVGADLEKHQSPGLAMQRHSDGEVGLAQGATGVQPGAAPLVTCPCAREWVRLGDAMRLVRSGRGVRVVCAGGGWGWEREKETRLSWDDYLPAPVESSSIAAAHVAVAASSDCSDCSK